jgi:hypothetical protein
VPDNFFVEIHSPTFRGQVRSDRAEYAVEPMSDALKAAVTAALTSEVRSNESPLALTDAVRPSPAAPPTAAPGHQPSARAAGPERIHRH